MTGVVIPAGADAVVRCPGGRIDEASAVAAARACGSSIEVLSLRSETGQTFANPDGSLRLETSVLPKRVRRTDGSWVAVDTSLRRRADGSLEPAAATLPVRFSGGGTGPLVAMSSRAGEIALSWPEPLPVPRVERDTAVYPDVFAGVDLRVRALASGFSYVFVVRTRQALSDPSLRRVGLRVSGVTPRAADNGGVEVVAPDGRVALASSSGIAWDSAGGERAAGLSGARLAAATAAGVVSSAEGPGDAAHTSPVSVSTTGRDLVLTPDPAWLDDPALVFPVYLDPQIAAPRNSWVYANSGNFSYDTVGDVARVGRNPDGTGGAWREYFQFDLDQVANAHILSAGFKTWLIHSSSCDPTWLGLWVTYAVPVGLSGTAVAWAPGDIQHLGNQSGNAHKGAKDCGYQPDIPMTWDLTGPVRNWTGGGWPQVTLALATKDNQTSNEGNWYYWKKFSAAGTNLIINYNHPPDAPAASALSTTGTSQSVACHTGTSGGEPRVNATGGATLTATLNDRQPDDIVVARFEWQDLSAGGATRVLPDTPGFTTPHTFGVTLPAAALPGGHTIQWRVHGWDGTDDGGTSAWCRFTVDNSAPGQPILASTDLPPYPATPPATTKVGTPAAVTVTPAGGDTDVAGYYYGAGAVETAPTAWIAAGTGGRAVIPVVPVRSGLTKNFLTVVAVDAAGNRSPLPVSAADAPGTRQFRANPATATGRARGDTTGDGKAEFLGVQDAGGGRVATWQFDARLDGSGLFDPVTTFDSTSYPPGQSKWAPGDFDGDGRTEIAVFSQPGASQTLSVLRSEGNGMVATPPLWTGVSGWNIARGRPVAADFNGDGRTDLAQMYDWGNLEWVIWVWLSTSAGPGQLSFAAPARWWHNPQGYADWNREAIVAGDFDGDGKADIAALYDYDGCVTRLWIHPSTGTGFTSPPLVWSSTTSFPGGWCWARSRMLTGDFDGAGADDIAIVYDEGDFEWRAWMLRSTGSPGTFAFTDAQRWWHNPVGAANAAPARFAAGDHNGDGRTDIASITDHGGCTAKAWISTSTGTAFAAPALSWTSAPGRWCWQGSTPL